MVFHAIFVDPTTKSEREMLRRNSQKNCIIVNIYNTTHKDLLNLKEISILHIQNSIAWLNQQNVAHNWDLKTQNYFYKSLMQFSYWLYLKNILKLHRQDVKLIFPRPHSSIIVIKNPVSRYLRWIRIKKGDRERSAGTILS